MIVSMAYNPDLIRKHGISLALQSREAAFSGMYTKSCSFVCSFFIYNLDFHSSDLVFKSRVRPLCSQDLKFILFP